MDVAYSSASYRERNRSTARNVRGVLGCTLFSLHFLGLGCQVEGSHRLLSAFTYSLLPPCKSTKRHHCAASMQMTRGLPLSQKLRHVI
jgi:hypothetical protein